MAAGVDDNIGLSFFLKVSYNFLYMKSSVRLFLSQFVWIGI